MDTTTAIIQFIGIVLFSSSIPNDPGVHAILPRIGSDHGMHISMGDTKLPRESDPSQVEDHVAVVIYRNEDLLSDSGRWKTTGRLDNGWRYVELDGEHVEFLTNQRNGEPRIPAELPRPVPSESCLQVAGKPATLKDEFQGPNYKGAVAVFDIPFGTLDTCAAVTPSEAERIDTALLLRTKGVVVVAAKKTTELAAKTLTLDGDAVVFVANVPPHYLLKGVPSPESQGAAHWEAYNAMLDTQCPGRPEPPRVTKPCNLSAISTAWKIASDRKTAPEVIRIVDSGCSNTQWP